MKTFSQNDFITDLTDFLTDEIKNGYDADIYGLISEYIESEIIYYSDCWAICYELQANNFDSFGLECNNITQLAYCSLHELVNEKLNYSDFEQLQNEKENEN